MIPHRLPATNIPHAGREAQESILADADTLVSIESSCRPQPSRSTRTRRSGRPVAALRLGRPPSDTMHASSSKAASTGPSKHVAKGLEFSLGPGLSPRSFIQ